MSRIRTLYAKLALALAGLFLALGILLLVANLISTRRFLTEVNQRLHLNLATHLVKDALPISDGHVRPEALEQIFHMLMVVNPTIEVYLIDPNGHILEYDAPHGAVVRQRVGLEPIEDFLAGEKALPIFGDDPRDRERRKPFSVAPILNGSTLEGYLYVILGGEQYDSEIAMLQGSHTLRVGFGLSLVALALLLGAGLLVFSLITRRVRKLAARVDSFESDGLLEQSRSPQDAGSDEISRLNRSFERMAARLAAQLDELKKTDALRRELTANISHDLRTPLTSLRGYLETLRAKTNTLSEGEKRDYLETALRQSERLSRLVAELFELAKLESATVEPEMEPLPIVDLVQDTAQDFQLSAREWGVRLLAETPDRSPMIVGDVALIARVLENLVDNGIRHTPGGGEVRLSVARHNGAVRVSVADTGRGISPTELPHVFDRYFQRSDSSVPGGSGLGLTISRRIVELHGSHLRVESQLGKGSRFFFDLPATTILQPA